MGRWKDFMYKEFSQITWDEQLADDCRHLVRLAVREDLDRGYDLTTLAIVPETAEGSVAIVARGAGTVAGLPAARLALEEMEIDAQWKQLVDDGTQVEAGTTLVEISASVRELLTAERLLLNLLGRLSGVATLTRQYVDAIAGTSARIYDTRKTTPGWRRLEKYAVRCGGGHNHRMGLYEAVLIKDNHIALAARESGDPKHTPSQAVNTARRFLAELFADDAPRLQSTIVEIEVDTLDQLADVLPAGPDIVLLDNMTPDQLRQAVAMRDEVNPQVQLEASGGVNLTTVRAIAETGVERISVGALTHSAVSLDVALDWLH